MMTRLQKRCLVTSAATHALLLALLIFAPGFRSPRTELLADGPALSLVPGELIDAALAPGPPPALEPSRSPDPTPPAAHSTPPVARAAEPERASAPEVPPPDPTPPPPDKSTHRVKAPPEAKVDLPITEGGSFVLPAAEKESPKKPPVKEKPKFNFNDAKPVKNPTPNLRLPDRDKFKPADRGADEGPAKPDTRMRDLAKSIASAAGSLEKGASRGTIEISVGGAGGGGGGGGGGGNSTYAWLVRQAYSNAWLSPQDVTDELATVEVEVTVRRDGKILTSRITKRSGIGSLDRSVQNALNKVFQIPPFEAGATEDQRTFPIDFNLRSRRTF